MSHNFINLILLFLQIARIFDINFRTICPLGDAAVMPIMSAIKLWRDEWQYHIEHGKCLVQTRFELAEGD